MARNGGALVMTYTACFDSPMRTRTSLCVALAVSFLDATMGCKTSSSTGGKGGHGGQGGTQPTALVAEAGYVEVPATAVVGPQYKARMFYSFRPADAEPEKKPLLVFFNGGPGAATTGILMVYGTGPMTLDADAAPTAPPAANPNSYTRFANLLYIDERMTGFSYGLGANACADGTDEYVEDASDYVYTLLSFLDAHEAIAKSPVVLVGESYGGTRAPMMLYELQQYAGPPATPLAGLPDVPTRVPWLQPRVQAHFDEIDPANKGMVRSPADVAKQFGWEALIQPNFFGQAQLMVESMARQNDPDFAAYNANPQMFDQEDIRKPAQYEIDLTNRATNTARDPMLLEQVLGVAPSSVKGLPAPDRAGSFRIVDPLLYDLNEVAQAEAKIRASLGALQPNDTYWLPQQGITCANQLGDEGSANALASGWQQTHVFVTNAHWDATVYTKALPQILTMTGESVTVDTTSPVGAARPGVIVLKGAATEDRHSLPELRSRPHGDEQRRRRSSATTSSIG